MSAPNGFALWLTGLPASGKSTLAQGLAEELRARGAPVHILDSDALRQVLTPEPTYSLEERTWFYQTMIYIGHLLTQYGVNVIFAATASRRAYRDRARQTFERFGEVHLDCSLETCLTRDQKGVYARALAGEATTVPGLQVPYEPPQNPELVIDAEQQRPEEGVRRLIDLLKKLSFL